jgi:hypothetical protein
MASNTLLCYNGQVYDLSRRDDRKATAQHAIDAEDEADAIQDRNARTTSLQAQAGKPHGRLPFGYVREYAVVGGRTRCIRQYEDPVRGPAVLHAFEHIDKGGSVLSLLRWMNSTPEAARPDGKPWTANTVRILLGNRAYLGERLHRGAYTNGTWEPIQGLHTPAGRAMFNRVVAKLANPARRTTRGTEPIHLLSYIALCAEHGGAKTLQSAPGPSKRSGRILTCKPSGDVSIMEAAAEAYVEEAVLTWLATPGARAALIPDDTEVGERMQQAQRRINAYEEQLAKSRALAREWDDQGGRFKLSPESLSDLEARLEPMLEAERKVLRTATGLSPVVHRLLDATDPDVMWNGREATAEAPAVPGLTLEQRREVIRKVVTVRVGKTKKLGSNKPDLNRIELSFVGEPGFRAQPLRVPGTALVQADVPPAGAGTE